MHVQEVIDIALSGNEDIAVTPAEPSSCEDAQVEKLAAALNFIGTNLESSVDEMSKEAYAGAIALGTGTALGAYSAEKQKERMRAAGFDEDEIDEHFTTTGRAVSGGLKSFAGSAIGEALIPGDVGYILGNVGGNMLAYNSPKSIADKAIRRRQKIRDRMDLERYRQKTAGVADEELAYLAQEGLASLEEKVAGPTHKYRKRKKNRRRRKAQARQRAAANLGTLNTAEHTTLSGLGDTLTTAKGSRSSGSRAPARLPKNTAGVRSNEHISLSGLSDTLDQTTVKGSRPGRAPARLPKNTAALRSNEHISLSGLGGVPDTLDMPKSVHVPRNAADLRSQQHISLSGLGGVPDTLDAPRSVHVPRNASDLRSQQHISLSGLGGVPDTRVDAPRSVHVPRNASDLRSQQHISLSGLGGVPDTLVDAPSTGGRAPARLSSASTHVDPTRTIYDPQTYPTSTSSPSTRSASSGTRSASTGTRSVSSSARRKGPKASPGFLERHGRKLGYGAAAAAAGGLGYLGYKKYKERKSQKKTASVDDALLYAAQVGKQSLLEKIAEDRINPAKISAGPAAPYSGEIMPNAGQVSNEFVGNTRDHHALIALKAQKVRDRINSDMKQYVNNVGDGYNLQGHLDKMNK